MGTSKARLEVSGVLESWHGASWDMEPGGNWIAGLRQGKVLESWMSWATGSRLEQGKVLENWMSWGTGSRLEQGRILGDGFSGNRSC